MSLKGHCLCQGITVEIPSQTEMTLCHCTSCRRTSGSSNSGNYLVQDDDLKVTGEPKMFLDKGSSGKPVRRYFCDTCGSPVYVEAELVTGHAFVRTGLFDPGSICKPTQHLFKRNFESWETVYPGAEAKETE